MQQLIRISVDNLKARSSWERNCKLDKKHGFLNSLLRNVNKGLVEICFCYLAYINGT